MRDIRELLKEAKVLLEIAPIGLATNKKSREYREKWYEQRGSLLAQIEAALEETQRIIIDKDVPSSTKRR